MMHPSQLERRTVSEMQALVKGPSPDDYRDVALHRIADALERLADATYAVAQATAGDLYEDGPQGFSGQSLSDVQR